MSLKDDLQMTKDFPTKSSEAYVAVVATANRLSNYSSRFHEAFGITPTQYNILRILRGSPNALSCTEIMNRVIEKSPDITRLLERLEAASFVERTRCQQDRRVVKTTITKKGLELLKRMDSQISQTHKPLDNLAESELDTLITLLEKVRGNIPETDE
jgi:DNA-binding MarR family transcriptional regulator